MQRDSSTPLRSARDDERATTTTEILKKIRTLEIKTRGLVETAFAGNYHSVFKGRGMNFEDVREYQPGDEIRSIDWNVTARLGADRKSTRLNSSHVSISYAVFCLKKKKNIIILKMTNKVPII